MFVEHKFDLIEHWKTSKKPKKELIEPPLEAKQAFMKDLLESIQNPNRPLLTVATLLKR